MERKELKTLCEELLDEHVPDWSKKWELKLTQARKYAGNCKFFVSVRATQLNQFQISLPYAKLNDEHEIRDTILHEIGHVLAGIEAGHGPRWRQIARSIGSAATVRSEGISPPKKFRATCTSCGYTYLADVRSKSARCCAALPNEDGVRSYFAGKCQLGEFEWTRND